MRCSYVFDEFTRGTVPVLPPITTETTTLTFRFAITAALSVKRGSNYGHLAERRACALALNFDVGEAFCSLPPNRLPGIVLHLIQPPHRVPDRYGWSSRLRTMPSRPGRSTSATARRRHRTRP